MKTGTCVALLLLVLIVPGIFAGEPDPTEARARAAYLDGDYDVGVALFKELAEKYGDGTEADRYAMLAVRGLSLATKHAEAADAGEAFLARWPQSRFREKIAYLTARELLLAGRGEDAAALMAASLGRLQAAEGRHRLAGYYIDAADRAYAGRSPADPFDAGIPPDYAKALRLYGLARAIGLPADRKEELVLRIARAAVQTRGWSLVLDVLNKRDSGEALYLKGRARIGLGQIDLAKEVFERLLTEHADSPFGPEALFLLGTPEALARLIETYPDHALAPRAGFRRGDLLAKAGHADSAVAAWDETARRFPASEEAPKAALAAANLLGSRSARFAEAERRYRNFLRDYPDRPEFATARDGLTRTWYARGRRLLNAKSTDEAAKIWAGLRSAYPLSPYSSRTLWEEAQVRKGDAATKLLRELVSRYPKSKEAPRAALHVASELQDLPGRVADAVAALKRVMLLYPGSAEAKKAGARLRVMKEKSLEVVLPAPRPAGGTPTLVLRTRNVSELSGRIYRLDSVRYFRKHGSLAGIDKLMLEVVTPDARFTHAVADYEDYRVIKGELPVPVAAAGTYVVVVEGGDLAAVGLLVVSDISLITKESPGGVLGFVQRTGSGEPVEGATLLVRDGQGKVREAVSGKDGVARIRFDNRRGGLGVLATLSDSIAIDDYHAASRKLRGLKTRVHITTDRPLYRSGHTVRYRAVVRRASGGFFETPSGEAVHALVTDRAGNRLHSMEGNLSDFGTTDGEFVLPADLPPADYVIQIAFGGETYRQSFQVRAYRKPQIFIEAKPAKADYLAGDDVTVEIQARYSFGRPVAKLPVLVFVKSPSTGDSGKNAPRRDLVTDERGVASFVVATRPGADREIRVHVQATDATRRNYGVTRHLLIPAAGFRATLASSLDSAFKGEEIRLILRTMDAMGDPVAAQGEIEIGRSAAGGPNPAFSVVSKIPVATDESGRTEVTVALSETGPHRFLFRGKDRRDKVVTAEVRLSVIEDANRLVVRAERSEYHVGETARVTITSPAPGRHLLLTHEGEDVYGYRVMRLEKTRNVIDLPITPDLVPDIRIETALAHEGRLLKGGDHVKVFERIVVSVKPAKPEYGPGELCRISITTKNDSGDPVPAEVALAVVDEAIFRLAADKSSPMATFFRPSDRPHLVRTGTSLDFSYRGTTAAISSDLLAERDRRKSAADDDEDVPVYLEEESMDHMSDAPFDGPSTNAAIGIGGGAGGAFGGRGGHRNLRAEGGGGMTTRSILARVSFQDTAFWRANVKTDADGKATVEFRLPDDLTEWRVTARGASHGNACGETLAAVTTSRPLVVRSALPRFLREGDRLLAAAGVVNGTASPIEAEVSLRFGDDAVAGGSLTLESGEERHMDWPVAGGVPGKVSCEARAEADDGKLADAERRNLPVLAFGVPFRTGFAGLSKDPGERILEVPDDFVPGTLSLTLHAAPGLARAVFDGVADLKAFPHGCVEQTVNRFLPALEAAAAIRSLGLDEGNAVPDLMKTARAGALRLTYLRNSAKLWGWWARGKSHPQMTAYALLALGRARQEGIEFSPKVLPEAAKALDKLLGETTSPDDRAFLLYAKSVAARAGGRSDFMDLSPTYSDRSRLGPRGLAHLLLAYQALDEGFQVPVLAGELAGRVRSPAKTDTETLGWVLFALANHDANSTEATAIADEILRRRQGRGFGTTRETGAVVMGLGRLAQARGLTEASATFEVLMDGKKIAAGAVPRGAVRLPVDGLAAGRRRIEVRFGAAGTVSYAVSLRGVRRKAPDGGRALTVSRKHTLVPWVHDPYASVARSPIRGARAVSEAEVSVVRTGELVRVTLEVENPDRLDHLVVSDALPAGFEPVAFDAETTGVSESVRYDDRILFFIDRAPRRVRITYLLRGEAPGKVRIPPAIAYAMYRPAVAAYSVGAALDVAGPDEKIDRDPLAGLWATDLWDRATEARDAGESARAAEILEALLVRFSLPFDSRRTVFRTLAGIRQTLNDHAAAVACFERLRAEYPKFVTSLDDERRLATSYRALGRHGEAVRSLERAAYLLYVTEERIPKELDEDARVALRTALLDRYPFSPYVMSAWNGLANSRLAGWESAVEAGREASAANLAPMREFLARYPDSLLAPPGAFRLVRTNLRAKRWADLARETAVFSERWADHVLADDADWFRAFALFAERRYDDAEAVAKASLAKKYKTRDGREAKTEFRKNLIHMRAQVAHIGGRMKEAAELYRQVAQYTPDARESLRQLTEERLSVAEVTRAAPGATVALPLTAKNVSEVVLDVYAIDLLTYFTLTKDVSRVSALNLDGIPAAIRKTVAVPGSDDMREHRLEVPLPGLEPGVYLVLARADVRERRALVIVSDLTARVWRHADGVRVLVTDGEGNPVRGAFVKIAGGNTLVGEGKTDARGVFEVRRKSLAGHDGKFTAVAAKDGSFALTKE